MTKHKSGWYKSDSGVEFHALAAGDGMSDETVSALGKLADTVRKMSTARCPSCGGTWRDPLNWEQGKGWFCKCGWAGGEPRYEETPNEGTQGT